MADRPPRTDYFREIEAWERRNPSIADSVATSLSILVSVADSKGVRASSMASSVSINTSGANSRAVQASSMASSNSINISTAWTMAASASTRASSVSVNVSTVASSLSLVTSTADSKGIQASSMASSGSLNASVALAVGSEASSMASSVSLNLSTAGSSLSLITSTADSKGVQASSMASSVSLLASTADSKAVSVSTELNIIRFAAHKNGTNQTGIVTATPTAVTFGTEVYDIVNNYDTGTSQWVPGIIGKAHISAMITWTAAADQTEITILLYKNGASYKQETRKTSGTGEHCNHIDCDILVDVITDYFEIYAYQASGGDKIISGDITKTWFMGHMLPN